MKKKKLKIKWNNVVKIIDLALFIFCVRVLIYDMNMFLKGWTINWIGIIELIVAMTLLDLLFEEYKKVLKATVSKGLRVLRCK